MTGNGSIYKRGAVLWIRYSVGGHEHRESARTDRQSEARALLAQRLTEARGGRAPHLAPKLTVSEALAAFLEDQRIAGRRSLRQTTGHVAPVREAFGPRRLVDVTTEALRAYVRARQAQGKAPATINRELAALRRAMRLAVAEGRSAWVPAFPCLKEENARRGFFTRDEADAILAALRDDDVRDFVEWAYWTGMRRGEAAGLRWLDYSPDEGLLRLHESEAKTGEGRALPVVGPLLAILERRLKRKDVNPEFIFGRKGKRMATFRVTWARACRSAGCPGRLFHDLRRTGVRNLIRAGVSRKVAMAISGHKTEAVFNRYDITAGDDLREAIEAVASSQDRQAPQGCVAARSVAPGTLGAAPEAARAFPV
jgi:integrase